MNFLAQLLLFMLVSSGADLGTSFAKRKLGLNTEEELQKTALEKELAEKKSTREATTMLRKSERAQAKKGALAQIAMGLEQGNMERRGQLLSNPAVLDAMDQSVDLQDLLGVRF